MKKLSQGFEIIESRTKVTEFNQEPVHIFLDRRIVLRDDEIMWGLDNK